MVKTNPSTIVLKSRDYQMNEGIVSNATITPGHLVIIHTDGTIRKQATTNRRPPCQFAVEYELSNDGQVAGGISTVYAIGDRIKYGTFKPGDEIYARVAAAAAAIAIGARLTADATGCVKVSAAANDDFAEALEAVDNSGGGGEVRIRIRIV